MKKLNSILKLAVIILFTVLIASCKKEKDEDPYADLKISIKRYVVNSSIDNKILYTAQGEAALIKEWLDTMTINQEVIDTTASGLSYIVEKVGSGEKLKTGNTVKVKYIGFFTNGTIFDASAYHGDGTMTYVHKVTQLIKGWEEGTEVLQEGGRAVFLIPSAQGYGSAGYSSIPPNTPLIFIIEVVDIK